MTFLRYKSVQQYVMACYVHKHKHMYMSVEVMGDTNSINPQLQISRNSLLPTPIPPALLLSTDTVSHIKMCAMTSHSRLAEQAAGLINDYLPRILILHDPITEITSSTTTF